MLIQKWTSRVALLFLATLGSATSVLALEPFQIGVCVHMTKTGRTADIGPLLDQAQLSFRDDVMWGGIEIKKNALQFPPQYHELELLINDAAAHGKSPILILDFGNQNYDNGDLPRSQAALDGYARYVSFIVKYFKGRVSQFEVWNEWNGGMGSVSGKPQTGDTYVPLLKVAYNAIKAANPAATVIGGAMSWTDQTWLDAFANAGGLDYLDALSVHPYVLNPYMIKPNFSVPNSPQEVHISQSVANATGKTSPSGQPVAPFVPIRGTPESAIQNVDIFKANLDVLSHGKSIPLYVTEMGWPTSTTQVGVSEAQQTAYMMRFLLLARARPWIAGVWWYDLINDGGSPEIDLHNFGLLENPSAPKQAYQALAGITDVLLSGKPTVVTTDAKGITVVTGYTTAGQSVKVTWLATNQLDAKQALDSSSVFGSRFHAAAASGASPSNSVTYMPTLYRE